MITVGRCEIHSLAMSYSAPLCFNFLSLEGINSIPCFSIIPCPGRKTNEQEQTNKQKELKTCKEIRAVYVIILTLNMAST